MSLSTNGEFDAHILRIDRNQELKKKFGISYTRFAEIDPTPIKKWLVKDFLGAGEMSCAYGPPGSAKSLLAGDLAAHVAWGQDWTGRRVSQGAVLFVAIERAGLVKRRLAGISQHHGSAELPLAVLRGQMTTVELAGSIYARPTKSWHRWNVRRAALKVAVHVQRGRGGWLWRLK